MQPEVKHNREVGFGANAFLTNCGTRAPISRLVMESGVLVIRRVAIYVSEIRILQTVILNPRRDRGDAARAVCLRAVEE